MKRDRLRVHDRVWLWASRLIIWLAIAVSLLPVAAVVITSLSPSGSFFTPDMLPKTWTLKNYVDLFAKGAKSDFVVWVKNTFVIGATVGLVTTFTVVLAAYAISRMRFRGRRYGLLTVFILQMFPAFMSLPAFFRLLIMVNGLDTIWGLALILSGTGAFNIWLTKNYIDQLPRQLDEAAMVDGASYFTVFWRIIIPLTRPMLVVLFLWGFMGVINEYALTSVMIKSPHNYTIPLGLKTYRDQFTTRWGQFAAATILSSIPVAIMWVFSQKWVQQGLTQGAIKE